MRAINGNSARPISLADVTAWAAAYPEVTVDLGTGDGRYVRDLARQEPERAVIGIDTSHAGLGRYSRRAPANALFLVGDALALPAELHRLATAVTINFPWGSLLRGLLEGHPGLRAGLSAIGRSGQTLEVRLNAGALHEAGWDLEAGAAQVVAVLRRDGFQVGRVRHLESGHLRDLPTTWAKRLAFGRDPRAIAFRAVFPDPAREPAGMALTPARPAPLAVGRAPASLAG